jgi:hypothetical protein
MRCGTVVYSWAVTIRAVDIVTALRAQSPAQRLHIVG